MKKNKITIAILIVLTVISIFLICNNSSSTMKKENIDFAVEDTSNITRIFLADKNGNKVVLKRLSQSDWIVNDKYNVSKDMIQTILRTISDLEIQMTIPKTARKNVLKSIASTGVKVEIYQMKHKINLFNKIKLFLTEQKVKTYYVGGPNQNHLGTRMLLEGSTEPYSIVIAGFQGFLTPRYSTKENEWRDRRIFYTNNLSTIKSIKIEFPNEPEKSFIFENDPKGAYIKNIKGEKINQDIDSSRFNRYLLSFYSVSFERFLDELSPNTRDSIIHLKPENIVSITTKDTTIVVKTIKKTSASGEIDPITGMEIDMDRDRLYGLINNDKELTICQYNEFDRILRPINYFILNKSQSSKK